MQPLKTARRWQLQQLAVPRRQRMIGPMQPRGRVARGHRVPRYPYVGIDDLDDWSCAGSAESGTDIQVVVSNLGGALAGLVARGANSQAL